MKRPSLLIRLSEAENQAFETVRVELERLLNRNFPSETISRAKACKQIFLHGLSSYPRVTNSSAKR